MKVLRGPFAAWKRPAGPSAVTIGVFDGVHRGHQTVVRRLQAEAEARPTVVLTFARHPAAVLAPESRQQLLSPPDQRLRLLGDLGVDYVAHLEFDEAMRVMEADAFVHEIVVGALDAEIVVVGRDFSFGHGSRGDVPLLERLGRSAGYRVVPVELESEGTAISSTRIRNLLAGGQLTVAARLLGRHFFVEGKVVSGAGRGKSIGVPTANLELHPDQMLPKGGVYAVIMTVDGKPLPGVANVGIRPTFGGDLLVVEVHLFDFGGDLYGSTAAVEFRHRIRDEFKFSGVDELVAQIRRDIDEGARLLAVEHGRGGDARP